MAVARTFKVTPGTGTNLRIGHQFSKPSQITGRVLNSTNQVVTTNIDFNYYDFSFSVPASATVTLPTTLRVFATRPGHVEELIAEVTLIEKSGPVGLADVQAVIDQSIAAPVKRAMLSLGATNSTQPVSGTLTDWVERIPVLLPVNTTRWRLRIGNRNLITNLNLTSVFNFSNIYLGDVASPGVNRQTAAYASAPEVVSPGGVNAADGGDFVSNWVTDTNHQFSPNKLRMVSWNMFGAANGNGYSQKGARTGFRNANAGAAGTIANLAAAGYAPTFGLLDVRIEYEFQGNNPIGLFIGASNDEGYAVTDTSPFIMTHEAWPGAYGMRRNIPWVNAAIAGATETPFLSQNNLAYTRFNLTQNPVDFAVVNMGGNSILGSATATTIQNNYASIINSLQALGINKIFLTTVQPLGLAVGSAQENVRAAMNDWIRGVPLGVHGVVDLDMILRNPAATNVLRPEFVLADNIHFKRGAHQLIANSIVLP